MVAHQRFGAACAVASRQSPRRSRGELRSRVLIVSVMFVVTLLSSRGLFGRASADSSHRSSSPDAPTENVEPAPTSARASAPPPPPPPPPSTQPPAFSPRESAVFQPQTGKMEPRFGRSVALLSKVVFVASPPIGDSSDAGGTVHVFGETHAGWRRIQRLFGSDVKANDRFGAALAAFGTRLVVGRDRADDVAADAGGATVFRRVGLHFRAEGELFADAPKAADGFGNAVAMDRERILVGASRDDGDEVGAGIDAGSATIFELQQGEWRRTATLLAPDGAASDWFGCSVALSGEGAVVGAYGDDDRGEKSGSVYVFRRTTDAGSPSWTVETKLAPDDLKAGDWFGFSTAYDGSFAAVGAPRDDHAGESAGSVRIYRRLRGEWVLDAHLRPPEGSVTAWFGYAVALDGGRLVVGAPGDDRAGESSGVAYLYERSAEGWALISTLQPSSAQEEFQCGAAVAVRDKAIVLGRLWNEDTELASGSAWLFAVEPDARASGRGDRPQPPGTTVSGESHRDTRHDGRQDDDHGATR